MNAVLICCALAVAAVEPLKPGDSTRTVQVDGRERSYIVHVPPKYDRQHPTPVILVFHGAWTNGVITQLYCGLDRNADDKNFITVYPNGTGPRAGNLFWNSGKWDQSILREPPNDVKFVGTLLDDLATVTNVDTKQVFATGISNGGMMCYKLAAEMPERIAAIAPISGTLCIDVPKLSRPVPVLHFHGTADTMVPFDGPKSGAAKWMGFKSVDDTIHTWAKLDGCPEKPITESLPDKVDDGTTVERLTYGPGKDGAEVILIKITGGGHNWPGRAMPIEIFGHTTRDISANDMMWDFFQRHPLK